MLQITSFLMCKMAEKELNILIYELLKWHKTVERVRCQKMFEGKMDNL